MTDILLVHCSELVAVEAAVAVVVAAAAAAAVDAVVVVAVVVVVAAAAAAAVEEPWMESRSVQCFGSSSNADRNNTDTTEKSGYGAEREQRDQGASTLMTQDTDCCSTNLTADRRSSWWRHLHGRNRLATWCTPIPLQLHLWCWG